MAKGSRKTRKREKARMQARPPEPAVVLPQLSSAARPKIATWLAIGASALLLLIGTALFWFKASNTSIDQHQTAELTFVGSQTCSGCHPSEANLWKDSQHRHAMDHATDAAVRGDFNDAAFEYAGTRSRFFRSGGKFLVETNGPDGKLATFEVKYTLGLDPLQQYLIEFPDGRVQALSIAWDTRSKDRGGQRWFHLYPESAITHDDPLHWTKLHQNWNFMCAECHSTDVRKNYDAANNRFATTFSEISVGCEACHGAGSRHIAWARQNAKSRSLDNGLLVKFDERTGITWSTQGTLIPTRSTPAPALRKEVETCGRCHARRGQLSEDWVPGKPLSETHRVSLLDRQRFHADGQMRDDEETYNYAPFKQSRMFAKGVTCSDCHDPHSARLKAPANATCAQCHVPGKYESVSHRQHENVAPPPTCASCHMPERRYMVIDRRHDHGFRIPRPDLSVQLGTPNACNDCHREKSAAWAAKQVETWFGAERRGYQSYASAFHAAWSEAADAQALLAALVQAGDVPALVRASGLAELPKPDVDVIRRGLSDPDPLVRLGALDALEGVPADQLWRFASSQLADPVRGVRMRAAELLASVPATRQPAVDRDKFAQAAAEFVAAQKLNADRPDARTALGNFFAHQTTAAEAEGEYRAALKLDPSFSPAAINLSDIYRQLGRDSDGERILRETLARSERDASLHHSLGLTLVRLKRSDAALNEFRLAAELDPERARYAYVYAIGLHSAGRREDARAVLKENLHRHPNDRENLSAAIAFSREGRDFVAALDYAERLARLVPDDPSLPKLIEELRRQNFAPVP